MARAPAILSARLTGIRPHLFLAAAAYFRYSGPQHMKTRFRAGDLRFSKVEHPPIRKRRASGAEIVNICPLSSPQQPAGKLGEAASGRLERGRRCWILKKRKYAARNCLWWVLDIAESIISGRIGAFSVLRIEISKICGKRTLACSRRAGRVGTATSGRKAGLSRCGMPCAQQPLCRWTCRCLRVFRQHFRSTVN